MADFTLTAAVGATVATWTDPAVTGKPARINPVPGLPHRHHTVAPGGGLTLRALVGGVLVADTGLGGRLFLWSWVDLPGGAPPAVSPTSGTSAEVIFAAGAFTGVEGHYTIMASREDGGAVAISWEAT